MLMTFKKINLDKLYVALLLLMLSFTTAFADSPNDAEVKCGSTASYTGEFTKLATEARDINRLLCANLLQFGNKFDQFTLRDKLDTYAKNARKQLQQSTGNAQPAFDSQFDALNSTFSQFGLKNQNLPEFTFSRPTGREALPAAYFTAIPDGTSRVKITEQGSCPSKASSKSCTDVFKDFADAFNTYRGSYDIAYETNTLLLESLSGRWDNFLEVSKSQTSLEVGLTTWLHKSHFKKGYLVGPPPSQIIALHPHLIYTYIEKAADGSNTESGLALELLGINWWDLKYPLGFSITSVYLDRSDLDDVGLGVMIHINNSYSIGWSDHGDKDSVYVTVDLLKLFEEKKQQLDKYKNNYFN